MNINSILATIANSSPGPRIGVTKTKNIDASSGVARGGQRVLQHPPLASDSAPQVL